MLPSPTCIFPGMSSSEPEAKNFPKFVSDLAKSWLVARLSQLSNKKDAIQSIELDNSLSMNEKAFVFTV